MAKFVIHIGAPRTGTTTLQKHVFPKLKETLGLCKRPFEGSLGSQLSPTKEFTIKRLNEYTDEERYYALENTIIPASLYRNASTSPNASSLIEALEQQSGIKQVLISSELLCDNPASLNCFSAHHNSHSNRFYIYNLLEIFKQLKVFPTLAICLREPYSYLASKYLRTIVQRESTGRHFLSPRQFIQKQVELESQEPGSSAIAPAMHKSFLHELSKHAKVNNFGFEDLLNSKDVFNLFQLEEPEKITFKGLPIENGLRFNNECKIQAKRQIESALQETPYWKPINDEKLHG